MVHSPIMRKTNVIELHEANEIIVREAFRRLGAKACLDTVRLREQIDEVAKEQAETIYAQLSDAAREQLRRKGLRISEQIARLARINEAIDYGHFFDCQVQGKDPWRIVGRRAAHICATLDGRYGWGEIARELSASGPTRNDLMGGRRMGIVQQER
jgi:hypothetical protein